MSFYARSAMWAVTMLLIALASMFGLISDRAGDVMLMAALGGWVVTAPRSGTCRLWGFRP